MKRNLSLILFAGVVVIALFTQTTTRSTARGPRQVANPRVGANALEFIGKLDQTDASHKGYGYLTHIDGLPDEQLFSDPALRNETTARFTFLADVVLNARHRVANLITTAADEGRLTVYFNETPAGNFNEPNSFGGGQLVGRYKGRFHTVCDVALEANLPSPGQAIITMSADLVQDAANPFQLGGQLLHVGHLNLLGRLTAQAHGFYTQPPPASRAQTYFGGYVVPSR